MHGLSADKLRVLLHPTDEVKKTDEDDDKKDDDDDEFAVDSVSATLKREDDLTDDSDSGEEAKKKNKMDFRESVVLTSLQDSTRGEWKSTEVLYSYPSTHKVKFMTLFDMVSCLCLLQIN